MTYRFLRSVLLVGLLLILLAFAHDVAWGRDASVVRHFRQANPCPATQRTTGACPGWVVDHLIPLCLNGPDEVANMGWQEVKASYEKDKVERRLCREAAELKRKAATCGAKP